MQMQLLRLLGAGDSLGFGGETSPQTYLGGSQAMQHQWVSPFACFHLLLSSYRLLRMSTANGTLCWSTIAADGTLTLLKRFLHSPSFVYVNGAEQVIYE